MRKTIAPEKLAESALNAIENFHPTFVNEVESAIHSNKFVIVGMAQNPVVSKARKLLNEKKITFKYLEYGSYFSKWKERLAIKLWSGWPTFPMVFVDGKLIGGCSELATYLQNQKT